MGLAGRVGYGQPHWAHGESCLARIAVHIDVEQHSFGGVGPGGKIVLGWGDPLSCLRIAQACHKGLFFSIYVMCRIHSSSTGRYPLGVSDVAGWQHPCRWSSHGGGAVLNCY